MTKRLIIWAVIALAVLFLNDMFLVWAISGQKALGGIYEYNLSYWGGGIGIGPLVGSGKQNQILASNSGSFSTGWTALTNGQTATSSSWVLSGTKVGDTCLANDSGLTATTTVSLTCQVITAGQVWVAFGALGTTTPSFGAGTLRVTTFRSAY